MIKKKNSNYNKIKNKELNIQLDKDKCKCVCVFRDAYLIARAEEEEEECEADYLSREMSNVEGDKQEGRTIRVEKSTENADQVKETEITQKLTVDEVSIEEYSRLLEKLKSIENLVGEGEDLTKTELIERLVTSLTV